MHKAPTFHWHTPTFQNKGLTPEPWWSRRLHNYTGVSVSLNEVTTAQVEPKGKKTDLYFRAPRYPKEVSRVLRYLGPPKLGTALQKEQGTQITALCAVGRITKIKTRKHIHTSTHSQVHKPKKTLPHHPGMSSDQFVPAESRFQGFTHTHTGLKAVVLHSSCNLIFHQHLTVLNTPCVFKWYFSII